MEWFFDGLGTQLVSSFFSLLIGTGIGGFVGYKIGIRKRVIKQKQKAGAHSKQRQIGVFGDKPAKDNLNMGLSTSKIKQYQKAGNGADQEQIGEINHDKR